MRREIRDLQSVVIKWGLGRTFISALPPRTLKWIMGIANFLHLKVMMVTSNHSTLTPTYRIDDAASSGSHERKTEIRSVVIIVGWHDDMLLSGESNGQIYKESKGSLNVH
jgi:hypothetical protein